MLVPEIPEMGLDEGEADQVQAKLISFVLEWDMSLDFQDKMAIIHGLNIKT